MNNLIDNYNKHKSFLTLISNSKPKQIKSLINSSNNKTIHFLCELCHNLLVGNLPIKEDEKLKLKKFKLRLRKLCLKTTSHHKKSILNQSGGFLNILIPALITGIATLIEHYQKE